MPKRSPREQRNAAFRARALAAPINTPFAGLAALLPGAPAAPVDTPLYAPVAQRIEHRPSKSGATGSNPVGRANDQPAGRRVRTSSLDAVLASVPQDKVAARVMGRGEHYEPDVEIDCDHWESPPPMVVTSKIGDPRAREFALQLIGRTWGRLTVVGLAAPGIGSNSSTAARWVVRCACGHFELRAAKTIQNANADGAMCRICNHVEQAKRRYDRQGGRAIEDFTGRGWRV